MPYFKPKKYIKDESFDPIYNPVNRAFVFRSRFVPYFSILAGLFILITQILLPVFIIKTSDTVTKPVSSSALGLASGFREFQFEELKNSSETNKKATEDEKEAINIPDYYYLTIPKLNIKKAKVEVAPSDLNPDDALGHYVGSAFPGEIGNTFIYGHSVLPWFYNPKNYKTIFATLHTLTVGDTFTIDYQSTTYHYVVESTHSLSPDDVDPLAEIKPRYLNESTVVLMTCTPPGTKTKRLLINAVLRDI